MQNKLFLMSAGLVLFIVSAVGGYFGPKAYMDWRTEKVRAAFVPPAVPQMEVDKFAAQFQEVFTATEPKTLPDVPLHLPDGKIVRISDFEGTPTLVNMWATWCAPCVVELPSLEKLSGLYKGRLNVIAVALEEKPPAEIAAFLEKRAMGDFAAHVDLTGEFSENLGLRGIPTSFLIGSDGQILYRFEGDADWAGPVSKSFFDVFLLQKR